MIDILALCFFMIVFRECQRFELVGLCTDFDLQGARFRDEHVCVEFGRFWHLSKRRVSKFDKHA